MLVRTPRELGLLIRERRRALGMTQQHLARKVGVGRQWVVEIEKGKPRAAVGLLLDALSVLGMVVDVRARPEPPYGPDGDVTDIDAVVDVARRPSA